MFKNYLKIALRNLMKQRIYSFINVTGLAIGISCALIFLLLIRHELSYDQYHKNVKNIYRIVTGGSDGLLQTATVNKELMPAIGNELSEVISYTRIWPVPGLISYDDKQVNPNNCFFVDTSFFKVFELPFLMGESRTAFSGPTSVVLTESLSKKYFNTDYPMGKVITVNGSECIVSAIIRDIPENSHFKFDLLLPVYSDEFLMSGGLSYTYVLLTDHADPDDFEKKLYNLKEKITNSRLQWFNYFLQPITSIHLQSHLRHENEINGNIKIVYLFAMIAFIILLLACINFINLSTARFSVRVKEIGVRKTIGAFRRQLITQLLSESIVFSIISLVLAIGLVEFLLPTVNNLSGRNFSLISGDFGFNIIGFLGMVLFVGVIAGSYPAFYLTSYNPVHILRNSYNINKVGSFVKKGLVIFQFIISIGLIIVTFVIFSQMYYMKNSDIGFNKEQIVVTSFPDMQKNYQVIKNNLIQNPNILMVSVATSIPGAEPVIDYFKIPHEMRNSLVEADIVITDQDFIKTMGIELIQGRDFRKEISSDVGSALIINEEAANQLGLESPIGETIHSNTKQFSGEIIGVVKDFHFQSFHHEIDPLVIVVGYDERNKDRIQPFSENNGMLIKIRAGHISEALDFIKETLQEIVSESYARIPFEYKFLDEIFNQQYQNEEKLLRIFNYFTMFAIIISCLGIFGLAAFMVEQRTKEIGIRKVLGASVSNILIMLTKDFTKWVLLANIIAWPIAYYAMSKWLQNFAYHVSLSWWIFVLSGMMALVIALLTVSYQAIRAATANPVESLRYE